MTTDCTTHILNDNINGILFLHGWRWKYSIKRKKRKRERGREKESNVRERRRPSVFSVSPIFVSRNDDAVCIPVADSIKIFGFTIPNCLHFKTL